MPIRIENDEALKELDERNAAASDAQFEDIFKRESFENYTDIDNFIYSMIPRDGVALEGKDLSGTVIKEIMGDESEAIFSDSTMSRAEFVSVLAYRGHEFAWDEETWDNLTVSDAEIGVMIEKMEKWGLDAADPHQANMIEGLALFHKYAELEKQYAQEGLERSDIDDVDTSITNMFNTVSSETVTHQPDALRVQDTVVPVNTLPTMSL